MSNNNNTTSKFIVPQIVATTVQTIGEISGDGSKITNILKSNIAPLEEHKNNIVFNDDTGKYYSPDVVKLFGNDMHFNCVCMSQVWTNICFRRGTHPQHH